jgi:hypothetical protein
VLKVRLTRAILDGTTLVEFGTNSLTLVAPAGYSAINAPDSATRNAFAVTRQWIEWGELDENTQPTLRLDIALANVQDQPAFEAAEALAWEKAEAKAAEAGRVTTMSEDGGEYAMSGGGSCIGCPAIETNGFSVCVVAYDASNSTASVTFESCDTHFYSIFSTDQLSTNTVWTFRTNFVGQVDSATWVDYDNLSVLTARFYRVSRLASDADPDLDGLNNAFELQYGLDPLDPADAAGDLDGDGYSNWDEMLMGTSPVATNDLVTVYVDGQNSSGPWDGTPAHPFRYIQDAMQCAVNVNSNLAIRVRPGNYYEPVSNVQYDFYGNALRLRGRVYLYAANDDWSLSSNPETHIIDASNLPHNDLLGNPGFGSAPAVEFLAVSRARIDGFTIRGGQGYSILAEGYYGAGILAYSPSGPVGGIYGYSTNSTRVRNCVIWGHDLDVALANVDYSTFGSNLVLNSGGHNVSLDPQLVNATAGNYRLQTNSLMRGTGTLLPIERRDLYGNSRPATGIFDIGANQYKDSDADGMQDDWESKHGLNPTNGGDAINDADGDSLNSLIEYNTNTDPQNQDTDGDGIPDNLDSDPTTPEMILTFEWHDPLHGSVWKYWINGTNDPAWLNQPPSQPRVMKFNNYHIGDRLALQQSYHSGPTNTLYFLVPLQTTGAFSVLPDADATPVWQLTQAAPIGDRTPPDPGWMTTVWSATPSRTDPCAGFDDDTPKFFPGAPYQLSVRQGGTNQFTLVIEPANVRTQVIFRIDKPSLASVDPVAPVGATGIVSIAGLATGNAITNAALTVAGYGAQNSHTTTAARVWIDVLPKRTNVTVAIYAIADANTPNTTPTNVPTQASLKYYLDAVYGRQANVYFNVLPVVSTNVAYDINGDGKRDVWSDLTTEMQVIRNTISTANAINVYYVRDMAPNIKVGTSNVQLTSCWIRDFHVGSPEYIAGHEIGHVLRLNHVYPWNGTADRLMWFETQANDPCRLVGVEWRTANQNAGP